jgi:hypothetical protein
MRARRADAAVRQLGVPEIYEAGWTFSTFFDRGSR